MSPRQTMSLGDTLLQLLFRFIVNTVYGAYLPRSYVGSDGLLLLLLLFEYFRPFGWPYVSDSVPAISIIQIRYSEEGSGTSKRNVM